MFPWGGREACWDGLTWSLAIILRTDLPLFYFYLSLKCPAANLTDHSTSALAKPAVKAAIKTHIRKVQSVFQKSRISKRRSVFLNSQTGPSALGEPPVCRSANLSQQIYEWVMCEKYMTARIAEASGMETLRRRGTSAPEVHKGAPFLADSLYECFKGWWIESKHVLWWPSGPKLWIYYFRGEINRTRRRRGEETFKPLIKLHVCTGVVDLVSFWFSHPLCHLCPLCHASKDPLDRDTAEGCKMVWFQSEALVFKILRLHLQHKQAYLFKFLKATFWLKLHVPATFWLEPCWQLTAFSTVVFIV